MERLDISDVDMFDGGVVNQASCFHVDGFRRPAKKEDPPQKETESEGTSFYDDFEDLCPEVREGSGATKHEEQKSHHL
jgi:glycosidase